MDRDLLLSCINAGMSTNQLSLKFNKGQSTIRYWLKKFNLKTINKSFTDGYNNFRKIDKNKQICCSCKEKLTEENAYNRKTRDCYLNLCKVCCCKYTSNQRKKFKQ